jgi:Alkylmercury lyase
LVVTPPEGKESAMTYQVTQAGGGESDAVAATVHAAEVTQRVRRAAFLRLLEGHAAGVEYLAGHVHISVAAATEAVESLVKARRAVTDADGHVVGAGGLSLVETAHVLRIAGTQTRWCWCAWDALGIASALRLTATISTPCGACGHRLVLESSRGELAAGGTEFGYLPPHVGSPLSCFCPYALLFCSERHLASWQAELPASVAEGGRGLAAAGYAAEARHGWSWIGDAANLAG